MSYIHRVIEKTVLRYLSIFPVVGITGPRQSGKSTMLHSLLDKSHRYISFDDLNYVDQFHTDPQRFMRLYSDKIIFDEVQRVPEIFSYVKLAVDRDRRKYGKFLLTGSSQFTLMKRVSESLAGRIGLLSLLPFQCSEVPRKLRNDSIHKGGYPELVLRNYDSAFDWFNSYIDTYLTRDVRDIREIGDIRDFRRFIQILAARVSQVLNMSEISRDIGVSVPTIKKWLSVLEASYIVFLLPPYYDNLGKRIVKSPKIYFYDTGLVSYLTGIRNTELFEKGPLYGPLFENYLISEITKRELHTKSGSEMFYYRTSNGVEVDLIIDRKDSRDFVEIKATQTFRVEHVRSLELVKNKKDRGILLYQGRTLPYTDDISIVFFQEYLESES